MEIFDVIVIGAGPSGMMAAVKAGEKGKKVLLLEKTGDIGTKLSLAGNKRGNLTNLGEMDGFIEKYKNGMFLRNGFAVFFNDDLVEFFEGAGLPLKAERGGRVYPESDKASDVVKVLRKLLKKRGVQVGLNRDAYSIARIEDFFEVTASKKRFAGRKAVIACGGRSFPWTGSDGGGYRLAEQAGHTVVRPVPALCGIEVERKAIMRSCSGVALKNVKVAASFKGETIGEEFGEVLFTHYGFSGPAVLNLSGDISEKLAEGSVTISINLKPSLSEAQIDGRLQRELDDSGKKHLKNMFKSLLPSGTIQGFLKYAAVEGDKPGNQVTREERIRLVEALMNFSFVVRNAMPFSDSMVTRGGVSVGEINPKTMESRIVPGLFFAGEVIDVDGKTGGYNLQAAFTTGHVAGISV